MHPTFSGFGLVFAVWASPRTSAAMAGNTSMVAGVLSSWRPATLVHESWRAFLLLVQQVLDRNVHLCKSSSHLPPWFEITLVKGLNTHNLIGPSVMKIRAMAAAPALMAHRASAGWRIPLSGYCVANNSDTLWNI